MDAPTPPAVTTKVSRIAQLKQDLRNCREQVQLKSQLFEEAQSSNLILTEQVENLQQQLEVLKADNARCHSKEQVVAIEHDVVLEQKKHLERQLREEQKQKEELVAHLRVLASNICGASNLEGMSAVTLVKAVGAEVGKLSDDCHSLRQSERLANEKAESMRALKDASAAEIARLKEQLMDLQELKSETEILCEAISNFELQAEERAQELEHAKEEIESLKESLAEAQAQVVPLEECKKAALLMLERKRQISQFEKACKEMEENVAKLIQEKPADADMARVVRRMIKELKGQVLQLAGWLAHAQEHRNSMVDGDVQTESLPRADRDVQTENNTLVDCVMQTECLPRADRGMQVESVGKVDCVMQTECLPRANRGVQAESVGKVYCVKQTQCLPRAGHGVQAERVGKVDSDIQTQVTMKTDQDMQTVAHKVTSSAVPKKLTGAASRDAAPPSTEDSSRMPFKRRKL